MYGNKLKTREKQYHQKFCRNSALCSTSYKSSSRPLEINSTVQNVFPDSVKLLSKNGNDPPVQSLEIDRFLDCCSENQELAAAPFCFFLSFIFCSLINWWWLPKKRVYTNTLVSQVNKKTMTWRFWALFDGLSSWAKENKPNKVPRCPSVKSLQTNHCQLPSN